MERIRAFIFDHRRPLAAACAALAVLAAIDALQPQSDTTSLTVVAHDIESGRILSSKDLTTAQVPKSAHPSHALAVKDAVGRRAAGPMRAGEAVTDRRVLSSRDLGDQGVLTMVSIDDPAALIGIRVGDRVDVVTTAGEGRAHVVVRGASVATLPATANGSVATVGLSSSDNDALILADAAVDGGIRLVVRA